MVPLLRTDGRQVPGSELRGTDRTMTKAQIQALLIVGEETIEQERNRAAKDSVNPKIASP